MSRAKINHCEKCNGEGWLWRHELALEFDPDDYRRRYGRDDTKYTCDACYGEEDVELVSRRKMAEFDPGI